jgi:hypothetical protein
MRIVGAVLIVAMLCLPADAAEEKPAATVTNSSIEAAVTIDPAIKAYPALYDNLLAEGKRQLVKESASAEKDRKELPDVFRDGRRYDYERGYSIRSVIGRYISVLRIDYLNALGAHPNHFTNTILWDTQAKKRLSMRPFFTETADNGPAMTALAKAIRAALAKQKMARDIEVDDPDTDDQLAAVTPSLLKIGAAALAPSTKANKSAGFICYFSPYAVGAYAEGGYTVFVPWNAFKTHLSHEGKALFGGKRPPGDADKD